MPELVLYDDYSREDVHSIFSPDTAFTPQAGTWGLQGVVPIPDRPGDFVFFVTFGQTQGEHVFDEGITDEGVLTWQSQPQQDLNDKRIEQWIHHNEFENSIYLFLRTSAGRKYTYLGQLKYLSHDQERERPVYFQWQILDWSMPLEKKNAIGLKTQLEIFPNSQIISEAGFPIVSGELLAVPAPSKSSKFGMKTSQFKGQKKADYSLQDERDRKLWAAGELAVFEKEKQALLILGRPDLAEKVTHVSEIEGDGAGYDIKSFHEDRTVKYIEVKTTRGGISTPFFMSLNEIRFSEKHSENYVLCRVFEFDMEKNSGKVFSVIGNLKNELQFEAINFQVKI